ncbi:MAG: TIGR03032 family protein [Nostoc sp.]|uniref:TIGR03032 family protein n=1 Tax=Nostoc sp. TaxID=1180 RepID=UPI002FF627B6
MLSTFPTTAPEENNLIQCDADQGFISWLSQARGSVAITTYQAGKLALVGWNGEQITMLLRQFSKPMGLAVNGSRLALASHHEVCLLANAPALAYEFLEDQPGRYDALYLPRMAYFTGDLNIHDLEFGREGLWIVNTRFSCLSALSPDFSFVPRWHPKFISEVVPEDRCHLNGLAMVDGKPKYVTALGATDTVGGWRPGKANGGVVVEVESNEIIVDGLSMPHSPIWHDGFLWLLNSGAGEIWRIHPESGDKQVVCVLPGFLRGLCCVGYYALVGLCQIRERHIFGGLPITQRFEKLLCGVAVVDLRNGQQVGMLKFTAGCQELYDVQFLAGVQRPMVLNSERKEIRQAFTAPELNYWLRPSAVIPND